MTTETVRLHISPLTPALLQAVLGPGLIESAKNISYHEIQTFPEQNYGFVDLPKADAERLRRKLSGAILKGSKMKVDEARPKKRRRTEVSEEAADEPQVTTRSKEDRKKKRKSPRDNVVAGHELSPERKVKRAWTEPRKEKRSRNKKDSSIVQEASKYTDKAELLFRTKIPANKTDLVSKKDKKSKKSKNGAESSTVHEFEKSTTQPTFLKAQSSGTRSDLTYEDGKGWVDERGVVIEAEPTQMARKRDRTAGRAQKPAGRKPDLSLADAESSEESVDSESSVSTASTESEAAKQPGKDAAVESVERVSPTLPQDDAGRPSKPESSKSTDVHPLESLFKRPPKPTSQDVAKPSLEISTAFSFFDHDTDEDNNEPPMPLTPFTSQDLRSRGLRSAAPTPDTAFPSRFNSHDSLRIDDEDDEVNEVDEPSGPNQQLLDRRESPSKPASTVSDFEKHFWEKRGENNRAWKARRRAVLKEKRHRENRARRPKNW